MPLTYAGRTAFTYPSGLQAIHANFAIDGSGFYFASNGRVWVFNRDGSRASGADIALNGLQAGETVWGFSRMASGEWLAMVRDTSQTGTIGRVHLWSSSGQATRLSFFVPDVVTGINVVANRFRAPKGLAFGGGSYYVRVVRAVAGNMRFLRFDAAGAVQTDNLLVDNASVNVLSDCAMSADGGYLFIMNQSNDTAYAVLRTSFEEQEALRTRLDGQNQNPFAIGVHEDTLYVADRGGYVYSYSGIPSAPAPVVSGGGSGFPFGGFTSTAEVIIRNEWLGRDIRNRRNRR